MEIVYFHNDIEKFFEATNKSTRAKIARLLFLLAERGSMLGMPHVKNLGGGLYEARILGTQNIRILYTFHNKAVVLLHTVSKKTPKLSPRDTETAYSRLARLRNT